MRNGSWKPALISACAVVAIGGVGIYFSTQSPVDLESFASGNPAVARNRELSVGGIVRPSSDVRREKSAIENLRNRRQHQPNVTYGRQAAIPKETNAATEEVFAALTTPGKEAEASLYAELEEFKFEDYAQDPEAYLSRIVPSRVWQTAQPAEDVPVLASLNDGSNSLKQGESIRLQAKTAPNSPVTFVALDLGSFENQLTTISVQANDAGVAEAVFTATPGSIAVANVLAGSPTASGQASFRMLIQP